MSTGLQLAVEQTRAVYDTMPRPLLSQLCKLHRLSVRDFANIFGISKSHAEEIINHKKLPALDLAIRIARYWELTTDDLFGWRVDDDGSRRPLLIALPKGGTLRINNRNGKQDPVKIAKIFREVIRGGGGWKKGDDIAIYWD